MHPIPLLLAASALTTAVGDRTVIEDRRSLELAAGNEKVQRFGDFACRRIDLEFTSFEWAGEKWRHSAMLLLPARGRPVRGGVIVSGNGGIEHPKDSKYAEAAVRQDLATLLIGSDNPGPHYGEKEEDLVMAVGNGKYRETSDPRWIGYAWLARICLRGITAVQALTPVDRFLVMGGSKRGAAAWMAAAADPRVIAAFVRAWNAGNAVAYLENMKDRWGADYVPSLGPADRAARDAPGRRVQWARSPSGLVFRQTVDPYEQREALGAKPVLFAAGTNDPLFPPNSGNSFLPHMPPSVRILLLANRGHDVDEPIAYQAWSMWLRHVFGGGRIPAFTVEALQRSRILDVQVKGDGLVSARIWWAHDRAGAYQKAEWKPADAVRAGAGFRGAVPLPEAGYTAYFVEVTDTTGGIATSDLYEQKSAVAGKTNTSPNWPSGSR